MSAIYGCEAGSDATVVGEAGASGTSRFSSWVATGGVVEEGVDGDAGAELDSDGVVLSVEEGDDDSSAMLGSLTLSDAEEVMPTS